MKSTKQIRDAKLYKALYAVPIEERFEELAHLAKIVTAVIEDTANALKKIEEPKQSPRWN